MKKNITKNLKFGLREKGGRSMGAITAPRRGALTKRLYRFIDNKRSSYPGDSLIIVEPYLYDPNRTGYISLIMYPNGMLIYILAVTYHTDQKDIRNLSIPTYVKDMGYSKYIKEFKTGTNLNSIGFAAKSAGCSALLLSKQKGEHQIGRYTMRLPSGEYRLFVGETPAVYGRVSNDKHHLKQLRNAGNHRLLGFRPRVRPSSMNPVDHPMGGRTRGGFTPRSRTGKLSHGPATRRNKKNMALIIISARRARHKANKDNRPK